jgi:hypothetical protein
LPGRRVRFAVASALCRGELSADPAGLGGAVAYGRLLGDGAEPGVNYLWSYGHTEASTQVKSIPGPGALVAVSKETLKSLLVVHPCRLLNVNYSRSSGDPSRAA